MPFLKAILAFAVAVIAAITAAITDNHVTPVEGVVIAIAVVNSFNVLLVANLPSGIRWAAKALVAVSGAVLALLATLILGGLTPSELMQLALVGIQALIVFLTPEAATPSTARAR